MGTALHSLCVVDRAGVDLNLSMMRPCQCHHEQQCAVLLIQLFGVVRHVLVLVCCVNQVCTHVRTCAHLVPSLSEEI